MSNVIACIDASAAAPAVCDYASWASARLAAPLVLLHVLDHARYPVATDLSGELGFTTRPQLLEELADLDEKRTRLAVEHGRQLLDAATARLTAAGVEATQRQRHGNLAETLVELADDLRLAVLGLHGEASGGSTNRQRIGSQLEHVVRTLHRPVLLVPDRFSAPRSALLAFDGSANGRRCVERLAASPLLRELPLHVLMVAKPGAEATEQLDWAVSQLADAGLAVTRAQREGEVEPAIHAYQAEHHLDLLVMGAHGQSRIREFLLGSATTRLLRTTTSPLLILR